MDCIFCKIINGEIPARKVFENDRFLAILDAFPANAGHCLVIPKKHFANIFEIDDDTIGEAMQIAKNVAQKIKKAMNVENINIVQNNGAVAGQTVNHFHIHVIPRKEGDTVTIKSEIVQMSNEELDKICDDLK